MNKNRRQNAIRVYQSRNQGMSAKMATNGSITTPTTDVLWIEVTAILECRMVLDHSAIN